MVRSDSNCRSLVIRSLAKRIQSRVLELNALIQASLLLDFKAEKKIAEGLKKNAGEKNKPAKLNFETNRLNQLISAKSQKILEAICFIQIEVTTNHTEAELVFSRVGVFYDISKDNKDSIMVLFLRPFLKFLDCFSQIVGKFFHRELDLFLL